MNSFFPFIKAIHTYCHKIKPNKGYKVNLGVFCCQVLRRTCPKFQANLRGFSNYRLAASETFLPSYGEGG